MGIEFYRLHLLFRTYKISQIEKSQSSHLYSVFKTPSSVKRVKILLRNTSDYGPRIFFKDLTLT